MKRIILFWFFTMNIAIITNAQNFVYKPSGEFMELKKGKEIKISIDKIEQIDTLFIEDPSMSVGKISKIIEKKEVKRYIKNNVVYFPVYEINEYLNNETREQTAEIWGIQAFQALKINKTSKYGYVHDKKFRNVSLSFRNAISLDGEENGLCGFFAGSDIKEIIFSPHIKKIGKGAFRDCKYLERVVLHDGCLNVDIDPDAFAGCDALKTIKVPDGKAQDYINRGLSADLIVDEESPIHTQEKSMTIVVQEAGSLAKELGDMDLQLIKSLKIRGFLNTTDFSVINKMTNLEVIDLKDTYTYIPLSEKQKEASLAADLFGMASEAQYQKDGNSTNYNIRKDIGKHLGKIDESSIPCELPRNAFKGNSKLKCLKLPSNLANITRGGIGGSEGYWLSKIWNLEEVWLSESSLKTIPIKLIFNTDIIQIKYY